MMEFIIKKLEELQDAIARQQILQKEYLDVREAAVYLNLSTSALYKMTSGNSVPFYQPGGKKIYFKRAELDNWISSAKVTSCEEVNDEVDTYLKRKKS